MANRKRNVQLHFMVTERERSLIDEKMAQLGTKNMGAYLRKMAIDGYVIHLDLSDIRELVSLLRRTGNNLNQLTKRAHETGNIYKADIEDLRQSYDELWDMTGEILSRLSSI
ncbi:mobilisation protein (MobC) [Anaerosphaera aminiphila DSM 21120]|jgi:protein-tyrosine-phosphatase|uniref:Mobilisation protein (MobC) n=1 Tax=Anaerosphaera aminiphila DSM 21120 TaxID=1120995 RepID=A0A1M5SJ71_9FIRM|nr:plasmid mobilization relaxosome protein MobC [Anaerosphaera aminiphila]SHH38450.1 mobilisation protein (MobC) [Anaerosphaera aminiphila DSM 21120]HCR82570.1 plasmid mobilization relaxosome protein MobC [Lachnospiraceae bacterium]